jgi:hypothetical protein
VNTWLKATVVALLCLLLYATYGYAQEPQKSPGMAYRGWIYDGLSYREVFAPQQAPAIYLLAGQPIALSAHRTELYFWPISQRTMADWQGLDEPITGTVEVWQGNNAPLNITPILYSLAQPLENGAPSGNVTLETGAAAQSAYADYQQNLNDYWQKAGLYNQQQADYEKKLAEAAKEIAAGNRQFPIPTPPIEPPFPAVTVTRPEKGFILTLAEGRYRMRLKDSQGQTAPGSERELVVFSHRREGLSYTIIPESKWTQPVRSDDETETLYLAQEKSLYVQPRLSREYNERAFRRLLDPQDDSGREDRWQWEPLETRKDGVAALSAPGKEEQRSAYKAYYVEQSSGDTLGYTIREIPQDNQGGLKSSFHAYRLDLASASLPAVLSFRDDQGRVVKGSERPVRSATARSNGQAFLPALLPLLPALAFAIQRRRRRSRM